MDGAFFKSQDRHNDGADRKNPVEQPTVLVQTSEVQMGVIFIGAYAFHFIEPNYAK